MATQASDRVLVVLDVNVYLDVARLAGEPYTAEKFAQLASQHSAAEVPHRSDARVDSLRAIARLAGGSWADGTVVEVWTSDHIDLLAAHKASQPATAPDRRDRGLGWSDSGAQMLVDDLIAPVVAGSGGASIGPMSLSHWSPPLEHEDGIVLNTARLAGHEGQFYDRRYCITRDNGFLAHPQIGEVDVLSPSDWVIKHDAVARAVAMRRLLGGGSR